MSLLIVRLKILNLRRFILNMNMIIVQIGMKRKNCKGIRLVNYTGEILIISDNLLSNYKNLTS